MFIQSVKFRKMRINTTVSDLFSSSLKQQQTSLDTFSFKGKKITSIHDNDGHLFRVAFCFHADGVFASHFLSLHTVSRAAV